MNIYTPSEEECLEYYFEILHDKPEDIIEDIEFNAHVFSGSKNGNYGNPTNYKHNLKQRKKISENHAKHWQGKEVPWKGCTRADNYDRMHLLWEARRGTPSWNKGLETGPLSKNHKLKISNANKGKPKPIITCPHCGKKGGKPAMKQWHFDNCKELNNASGDFK